MLLLMGVASCGDDDVEPVPEPVVPGFPGETLARTLIVYIAAENSLASFVYSDSLEIAKGLSSIPDKSRVVLFIDDHKSSRLCVGTREEPLQQVKVYDRNLCATDEEDMGFVLADILRDYPAEHYGLVLWSHASGWMFQNNTHAVKRRSFGIDNGRRIGDSSNSQVNKGLEMNIPVMAQVLSRFPHLDFILFDACFMQCIEVAYELRAVTDYIIASPAEIPGPGAPYHCILQAMCQVPTDVKGVVNAYVDYYESKQAGSPYLGAELSLIRTDALQALAEASKPYLQMLLRGHFEVDASSVQRYCFVTSSQKYTEYYDMKSWMYASLSDDDYQDWCVAYEQAVPLARLSPEWFSANPTQTMRKVQDAEHCGGVSIFIPSTRYEQMGWTQAYHELAWYAAAGIDQTGW